MIEKKSMLVTGATHGTGYAIAKKFASEGYDVFITSRDGEAAKAAAEKLAQEVPGTAAFGYGLPVGGEQEILDMFAYIREKGYVVDTVVLNAANLGIAQDTLTVDIEKYKEVIYTNLIWNYMIARTAARGMKEKGGGAIVFINSNTAYRAIPARSAYSASKSGVLGLSRTLAMDLGQYNIRSNCVLPGMIKTDRWINNFNDCRNAPSNFTPLGDIAEFEDIANAAYYLGSDMSRNTTGAELTVDGGNMIQLYPIIPEK